MSSLPHKHVAVLPYPLPSHAQPLTNLMLKLAAAAPGVHFSFLGAIDRSEILSCSETPVNVKAYKVITSPWVNPLPSESQKEKVQRFFEGAPTTFEMAIKDVEEAVRVKVSCLLTDAFFTFACQIAEKMQVKWVPLWVGSPYTASTYVHNDEIVQKFLHDREASSLSDKTLEGIPGLSRMHIKDLPEVFDRIALQNNTFILYRMFRELGRVLPQADAVVMTSYEEVYSTALVLDLKSKFKELLLVGSLTASFSRPPLNSGSERTGCLAWLDDQKDHSVAYISFGSIVGLLPEEIFLLAEALEACKSPYLWSLKDDLKQHLPQGFEERTCYHGMIVPWAPQSQVLWHPSISTFVTQCGYNSIFESVAAEVPLICRPLWSDNKINSLMVEEEWGIGVTVGEGIITKNGMIECLEMVMGGGEMVKGIRMKIKAFKEVLMNAMGPSGSSSRDLKTLVDIISS